MIPGPMELAQETLLPQRTLFRKGAALNLAEESLEFGNGGLVVHGRSLEANGWKEKIMSRFPAASGTTSFCRDGGEPDLDEIERVIGAAKKAGARWIAGVGGGSVLDLAKAAAGLYNASERPRYYQRGGRLEEKGIPFIAVPTTAGTGSEATANSVIIDSRERSKLSIRDKSFLARTVILDPGLLEGLPPRVLSYAAMDALVQAYESYISRNATWFSGSLALRAMELVNGNILEAYSSPDEENLSGLLAGSYFAGIALASSRLGVIHGVAHPLGAIYGLPHGLVCSVCFLPSIKLNREAMGGKYDSMCGVLGQDLSRRVGELLAALGIASPFKGGKFERRDKIIGETLSSGSTAANPKKIGKEDVEFILEEISRGE